MLITFKLHSQLIISGIKNVLAKYWLTPRNMIELISDILRKYNIFGEINVNGETDNICAYIIIEHSVIIISPFSKISNNPILLSCNKEPVDEEADWCIIELDESLKKKLKFTNIVLINLCVKENFPIPRLNLSTASLASYLRKQHCANVTIIDMQFGDTVMDVVDMCSSIAPEIIGVSISFGQKDLAVELLDKLRQNNEICKNSPIYVVGNILPAASPNEFLELFDDIFVSYGEGEISLFDIVRYSRKEITIEQVSGIIFKDRHSGAINKNKIRLVDMHDLKTPSLDMIPYIAKEKGALTIETSRGCNYAKCTFCPREHKTMMWRSLSAKQVVDQIAKINNAAKLYNIKSHFYIADEEFIGELPNGKEVERILEICDGITAKALNIKFDISARADSVYDPKQSDEWNIRRFKMWIELRKAGLDKVFVGVESGSDEQLRRFGKGTTVEQNIIAIRLLTSIGINVRIGFIMFDPLMQNTDDIRNNISFLCRRDAIMNTINFNEYFLEDIYNSIVFNNASFIENNVRNECIYSLVSYMLASLEVLVYSPYARMLKKREEELNMQLIRDFNKPDMNMGRYKVDYINKGIKILSDSCQKWIDSNFALMYTIKSLNKVAKETEKTKLFQIMKRYRENCLYFLKYLLAIFGDEASNCNSINTQEFLCEADALRIISCFDYIASGDAVHDINNAMSLWQDVTMKPMIDEIVCLLQNGELSDSESHSLHHTIQTWYQRKGTWELIN